MSVAGDLWPYFVLVVFGFLPHEAWRLLGLLLSHGLNEQSEMLVWVRAVATAVLAGVIAKILLFPPGALASVPLGVRLGAVVLGFLGFLIVRRSVLAGVIIGEAAFLAGAWLAG